MPTNINDNHSKIKAFKLVREKEFGNALNLALDPIFEHNYEYVGWSGSFLYDLFCCLDDFGMLINMYLLNNETYFSGNAYCGEIIADNKIRFKDYEESFIHEMDFDEFLRVNKEFDELDRKKANEIWFKIIDDKIIVEGVWLDNTDHK